MFLRITHKFSLIWIVFLAVLCNFANAADIVSLTVQSKSSGTQTNIPLTFGHVFKQGDVGVGVGLGARLADGSQVALQVDRKATHADGSVRHAILTAKMTNLAGSANDVVTLFTTTGGLQNPAVQLSDLLATSFDAVASLNIGGSVYTASAANFLSNGNTLQWLAGSQVSEWIVGGPVKTSGGTPHPHLAAYFHVRAYAGNPINRVRVDVIIENGWTMVSAPNTFSYDVDISVQGTNVFSANSLAQKHHSRWRKTFWWGSAPQVYIKHDVTYLQDTKAVPKYENVTVASTYLASLRSRDIAPMDNGDFRTNMGTTGAHQSIAPLPRWTAAYLIMGDERAYNAMLANGDAGGAYYSHYRDETTGYSMKLTDHPNADLQATGGTGQLPSVSGGNGGLTVKLSHLPSIAYVPYLVTGDYFYLEEQQFWANWGPLWREKKIRNFADGLINGTQSRGQAWGMRELGRAAYITPDDHALKSYFEKMLNNNIDWYNANYADQAGSKHNPLGVIDPSTGRTGDRPWMDDFFTYAIGHIVELGFTSAIPMRDFKSSYVIGRVGRNDAFCWQFPTMYSGRVGPDELSYYANFDEYWEENWGGMEANGVFLRDVPCETEAMRSWMGLSDTARAPYELYEMFHPAGRPSQATSYYANMQPAAAITADAGLPESDIVKTRFFELTPVRPNYSNSPEWGIVPRSLTAIPAPTDPPVTPGGLQMQVNP